MKLFLCGLPNVGKTSLGRYLSEYLSLPFIDTDQRITQMYGNHQHTSPKEIFLAYGADIFHNMETQAILSLPQHSAVVALGGGSMMIHEVEEFVIKTGTLIFLSLPMSMVLHRLQTKMPERLKQSKDLLATLHHRQQHMQSLAQYTFDMTNVNLLDNNSLSSICQQISALF